MVEYHDDASEEHLAMVVGPITLTTGEEVLQFGFLDEEGATGPIFHLDRDSVAALVGQLQSWLDRTKQPAR